MVDYCSLAELMNPTAPCTGRVRVVRGSGRSRIVTGAGERGWRKGVPEQIVPTGGDGVGVLCETLRLVALFIGAGHLVDSCATAPPSFVQLSALTVTPFATS